eukprot:6312281-Amphidinium_carterae.1
MSSAVCAQCTRCAHQNACNFELPALAADMKPEHAQFLEQLPEEDLEEWEVQLRDALFAAVNAREGPFPLVDWLDCRVGGVLTFEKQGNEICRPGGTQVAEKEPAAQQQDKTFDADPVDAKESFFKTLPDDAFSPAEDIQV